MASIIPSDPLKIEIANMAVVDTYLDVLKDYKKSTIVNKILEKLYDGILAGVYGNVDVTKADKYFIDKYGPWFHLICLHIYKLTSYDMHIDIEELYSLITTTTVETRYQRRVKKVLDKFNSTNADILYAIVPLLGATELAIVPDSKIFKTAENEDFDKYNLYIKDIIISAMNISLLDATSSFSFAKTNCYISPNYDMPETVMVNMADKTNNICAIDMLPVYDYTRILTENLLEQYETKGLAQVYGVPVFQPLYPDNTIDTIATTLVLNTMGISITPTGIVYDAKTKIPYFQNNVATPLYKITAKALAVKLLFMGHEIKKLVDISTKINSRDVKDTLILMKKYLD